MTYSEINKKIVLTLTGGNEMGRENRNVCYPKGESLTQQHFKENQNIQNIMARYGKTGVVTASARRPSYGKFNTGMDYNECMNRVTAVEMEFSQLPGEIKRRFEQNPAKLIDFVMDENNRSEAIELGLIEGNTNTSIARAEQKEQAVEEKKEPKEAKETEA
jgi:phage internal scaffolding protein